MFTTFKTQIEAFNNSWGSAMRNAYDALKSEQANHRELVSLLVQDKDEDEYTDDSNEKKLDDLRPKIDEHDNLVQACSQLRSGQLPLYHRTFAGARNVLADCSNNDPLLQSIADTIETLHTIHDGPYYVLPMSMDSYKEEGKVGQLRYIAPCYSDDEKSIHLSVGLEMSTPYGVVVRWTTTELLYANLSNQQHPMITTADELLASLYFHVR